jgi:hypothetical protein
MELLFVCFFFFFTLFVALNDAAALLGCPSADLSVALTQRKVEVRGEKVKRDLSVNDVSGFLSRPEFETDF